MGDNVTFRRQEYDEAQPRIDTVRSIYSGIDSAKETLVMSPREGSFDFNNRVKMATLDNFVEQITTAMTGKIFRKPLTIDGATPTEERLISILTKNQNLNQFAKELTTNAIVDGKAYIMVDLPTDGGAPYFSLLYRSQIINWRKDSEGNFTLLVIKERYAIEGEFEVEYKTQYRVIRENGDIDIYRGDENAELYMSISTSYDFIPVYELDIGEVPPLYDIAKLNIAHFNRASKKSSYLDTAGTPIPFGVGLGIDETDVDGKDLSDDPEPGIVLGVNSMVLTDNPEARLEWVEMSGQNDERLDNDLKRLEAAMAKRALKLQDESTRTKTATQTQEESSESSSRLSDIAEDAERTINDAFNGAMMIAYSKERTVNIRLNRDFSPVANDGNVVTALNTLQISGNLSRETLLRALNDSELVMIDSIDDELARIEAENIGLENAGAQ